MRKIKEKLLELSEKYRVAEINRIDFEHGNIMVSCEKGQFRFFQTGSQESMEGSGDTIDVPLFYWRSKRRYIELRNILINGIVRYPSGMRSKHICSDGSLNDLLIREMDILEFVLNDKINKVFSSLDKENQYCNLILATKNGVKASMELGILSNITEPVEMHEVICNTGIVSDMAVDTQVEHYPIYVYGKGKTEVYKDIDYELYGMDNDDADRIRFITAVLADNSQIEALKNQYTHYMELRKAVYESNTFVSPIAI
jgi:hypothetical protein